MRSLVIATLILFGCSSKKEDSFEFKKNFSVQFFNNDFSRSCFITLTEKHLILQFQVPSKVKFNNFEIALNGVKVNSFEWICAMKSDAKSILHCSTDSEILSNEYFHSECTDNGLYTIQFHFNKKTILKNVRNITIKMHHNLGEKEISFDVT